MPDAQKVVVFVNGRARQVSDDRDLVSLIDELQLAPRMVLIEYNGRALHRHEWPGVKLAHGDRLEILRVVAGG
ncbi:MAG: sulfur carrier protein ThiS [Candidatus Methylacidiphilales bacterium]|nr:sulfur carrier protein ThiS [Candidatus Methylacidiphilales bacterium]